LNDPAIPLRLLPSGPDRIGGLTVRQSLGLYMVFFDYDFKINLS